MTETLCIWETPKQVLLQTVKTQMKCSKMLHFFGVYTVKVKNIFRQKNTMLLFFFKYNLTPLDIHNGPTQVYCIKPEDSISIQMVNFVFVE